MPAKDVAIDGTYTVNQYDAIFYVDGVVFATVPTNFGEVPAAPDVADAKPGYNFVKWEPALAEMTTAGATYNAVFSADANTAYTVQIYTMDTEGNYGAPEVLNLSGATDSTATYAPEAKTGFTIDAASVLEGTIKADGSLVLKSTGMVLCVAKGIECCSVRSDMHLFHIRIGRKYALGDGLCRSTLNGLARLGCFCLCHWCCVKMVLSIV